MTHDLPDEIKRWTAQRRATLVLQLLRGETNVNEAARQYDLKPSEILQWQDAFLAGGERSLKSNPNDELHEKDQKIDQLHRKIGQMTMDVEILTKAQEIMARELGGNPAGFGTGSGSKS